MSQRITPYWVGNVTYLRIPQKFQYVGPDDATHRYGSAMPFAKPLADVIPLISPTEKDVPQR